MSNQPFGQPPAFGAGVPTPSEPTPPADEPTGSRRTLVIAVAAGVAALGVLGGAAALVLGGADADTEDLALPAPSVAPVEPSVAPTQAAPLPTAAVKGRNVFVPLVEDTDGDAGAAADEGGSGSDLGAKPLEPLAVPTAGTGTRTGSGSGSGSGTGSFPTTGTGTRTGTGDGGSAPVVVYDPMMQRLLEAAVQEISRLEAEITALEAELRVASDDSDLRADLADLKAQRDQLDETVAELQTRLDARDAEDAERLLVLFKEATAEELVVTVGGEDIEIAVGSSAVIGDSGGEQPVPLELTFHSLDEDADPDLVTFTYGSGMSRVQVGATVGFPR